MAWYGNKWSVWRSWPLTTIRTETQRWCLRRCCIYHCFFLPAFLIAYYRCLTPLYAKPSFCSVLTHRFKFPSASCAWRREKTGGGPPSRKVITCRALLKETPPFSVIPSNIEHNDAWAGTANNYDNINYVDESNNIATTGSSGSSRNGKKHPVTQTRLDKRLGRLSIYSTGCCYTGMVVSLIVDCKLVCLHVKELPPGWILCSPTGHKGAEWEKKAKPLPDPRRVMERWS